MRCARRGTGWVSFLRWAPSTRGTSSSFGRRSGFSSVLARATRPVYMTAWPVLLLLGLAGGALTARAWRRLVVFYGMIAAIAAVILVTFFQNRFRAPLEPILLLCAGAAGHKKRRSVIGWLGQALIPDPVVGGNRLPDARQRNGAGYVQAAGEKIIAGRRIHRSAAGIARRIQRLLKSRGVIRPPIADGAEIFYIEYVRRRGRRGPAAIDPSS